MTLTVGSLFSGIGGIDLGLERAGMIVKWQSEIDSYACKVLKKHWPDTPNLGDIKQIDWSTVEAVDVIAGGYPCQPFSTAGKRQGENDPRHLWPYFRDAISGIRPRFAILENVRGHLSMGFDRVLADLTEIGYDCEWRVVSAAGMGAPHRRERIIIVAYPNSSESADGRKCPSLPCKSRSRGDDGSGSASDIRQIGMGSTRQHPSNVANTDNAGSGTSERDLGKGRSEITQDRQRNSRTQYGFSRRSTDMADTNGGRFKKCDTQKRDVSILNEVSQFVADTDGKQLGKHRSSDDVRFVSRIWRNNTTGQTTNDIGQWWETEPNVGRVADGVPARVDRLRGLGNAVVPQVAEYVGRLITQSLT